MLWNTLTENHFALLLASFYFPQQITQADTGGCSLTLPQHCPCAAFLAKCDLQALSGLSKPHVVFLQPSCSTRDSCWSPALPRGSPQAVQARCDLCQGCCAPQCCRCWRRGQGTVRPLHLGGLLPNSPSAGNSQRRFVWFGLQRARGARPCLITAPLAMSGKGIPGSTHMAVTFGCTG